MKFAWWPHTTNRAVASYRLRCSQVVGELQSWGVDAGYFRPANPPEVLVLSKRYDTESLRRAEAMRERHGTRLVLDLCDNHFYTDSNAMNWQRRTDALRAAVNSVDLVVTATPALADVVRAEAGRAVPTEVIGDAAEPPFTPSRPMRWRHPIAESRLAKLRAEIQSEPTAGGRRLVWFGNHGSGYAQGGMDDLSQLQEVLATAHLESPLSLTVISNNRRKFLELTRSWSIPTHYLDWHPSTISRALRLHHVTVIPIRSNPFTMCKTNNRVATGILHGLAVAADSIPSYRTLGDWLVLDDWDAGFKRLMTDAEYRKACVERGVEHFKSEWSLKRIVADWLRALSRIEAHQLP